jgi:putative nucleotidyltransferase with HDIG domain
MRNKYPFIAIKKKHVEFQPARNEEHSVAETDDDLLFADDDEAPITTSSAKPWKVMIADDEPEVHTITRLALTGFAFEGRPLEFLSAYSGQETLGLMEAHPDTALILLDVVMESEDSGLNAARAIRKAQGNRMTRIILRTGQPGQAPERQVILDYDINDYKTKTELTAQKLFTTVVASLRSYSDLEIIERNKIGLEQIIHASAFIFKLQSLERFVRGVLTQLISLLRLGRDSVYCSNAISSCATDERLVIIAGTGVYDNCARQPIARVLPPAVLDDVERAIHERQNVFVDDRIVLFFQGAAEHFSHTPRGWRGSVVYLEGANELGDFERNLLNIFCANVSVALDNISLTEELKNTQKEVVERIGAVAETRSEETGNHVKRVAEYAYLLAKAIGIDEDEAQAVREAAPLHDIGKVGIPDSILNKSGKLTEEEFNIIKRHAQIGADILSGSASNLLNLSALIAAQHHERYDGKGYPLGLKGEEIHLYGRIVAIADVFDALCSSRIYKPEWDIDRTFAYMEAGRGTQFDPRLIDVFLEHKDAILSIRESFKD